MGNSGSRVARTGLRLSTPARLKDNPGPISVAADSEALDRSHSHLDFRVDPLPDAERKNHQHDNADAFDVKNEALIANMQQAMAHPNAAIQFKEQLLPLDTDSAHSRRLIQQAEDEFAAMQSVFDRRTASEKIGGGRVSLEDMKAMLGAIQAQRGQEAAVELLASRYAVDPVMLRNVAKFYCIPRVKIVQLDDRPTMVAEWQ